MNRTELPSSWRLERIEDLCTPINVVDFKNRESESFRYVDISSVDNDQKIIKETSEIDNTEAPSRARQVIAKDDVLVSTVRPNLNAVAIVPEELDGEICSTGFCVLRAKEEILDPEYLFAWVRHPFFIQSLVRLERGIGYPAVSDSDVKSLKIPLPSLPEQRRIVAILREADELRQLRREADEKAKGLLPALFYEMFGNQTASSQERRIKDVIAYLQAGKSIQATPLPARAGKWGILKVSAVTYGRFQPEENKELHDNTLPPREYEVTNGDLLISRANTEEMVGASAIVRNVPNQLLIPDKLWRVILPEEPEVNLYFLYALLNTPRLRAEISRISSGTSGSMKNISQEKFLNLRINLPPKNIQDSFAKKMRLLWDAIVDSHETRASKIENLFQSFLAQAFSGELTAAWREENKDEVAEAVLKRDIELGSVHIVKQSFSANIEATRQIESPVSISVDVVEPITVPNREEAVAAFSRDQKAVLAAASRAMGYFTAERLAEENDLDSVTVKRGLEMLAAAGLVMPVSLLSDSPDREPFYFQAYRRLRDDDDAKGDLESFGALS